MYVINPQDIKKVICIREEFTGYTWKPKEIITTQETITKWFFFKSTKENTEEKYGKYYDKDGYYRKKAEFYSHIEFLKDGQIWSKPHIEIYYKDNNNVKRYFDTYDEVIECANNILDMNKDLREIFEYNKEEN